MANLVNPSGIIPHRKWPVLVTTLARQGTLFRWETECLLPGICWCGKHWQSETTKKRLQGTYNIPSGHLTVCELEHGHRNSGFSHEKWWFAIVFCMFTRGYNITSVLPPQKSSPTRSKVMLTDSTIQKGKLRRRVARLVDANSKPSIVSWYTNKIHGIFWMVKIIEHIEHH